MNLISNADGTDDVLFFAEENEQLPIHPSLKKKWKIMIADDEQEIHTITKLVLSDFEFDGKSLEFISAFSGEEAKSQMQKHPDIAVLLLDVVMEADDSGLQVARTIRERLQNFSTRIVLRTGQPGQAPEKMVIMDYDINDYKEKTELTAQKLFTTMITALRSYRDIQTIQKNKEGLMQIIHSSSFMFELRSIKTFAAGVIDQLNSILGGGLSGFTLLINNKALNALAAIGSYSHLEQEDSLDGIPSKLHLELEQLMKEKKNRYDGNRFFGYFRSKTGLENIFFLEGLVPLSDLEHDLIEIYCNNAAIAFDNLCLNQEIETTQKEIIFTLGEIAETRSEETGYHVKRVAEYSKILALGYGMSENEAELIRMASPMHDVGKVGVLDAILNKPGKLTPEEFDIMKSHATMGYEMLKHAKGGTISTAALIAHQHHEKYNGTGYPNQLKGDEIHIYARITAIADVFDALGSDRVYKKAWKIEKIIDLFKRERGEHFDPQLVDIFFTKIDEFIVIRDHYIDAKIF
ncbi:MAG: hypothetical protein JWM44_4472 [Bacilli bacterium]|nr:hypothetical protein [Bacilli bacterium]